MNLRKTILNVRSDMNAPLSKRETEYLRGLFFKREDSAPSEAETFMPHVRLSYVAEEVRVMYCLNRVFEVNSEFKKVTEITENNTLANIVEHLVAAGEKPGAGYAPKKGYVMKVFTDTHNVRIWDAVDVLVNKYKSM